MVWVRFVAASQIVPPFLLAVVASIISRSMLPEKTVRLDLAIAVLALRIGRSIAAVVDALMPLKAA